MATGSAGKLMLEDELNEWLLDMAEDEADSFEQDWNNAKTIYHAER